MDTEIELAVPSQASLRVEKHVETLQKTLGGPFATLPPKSSVAVVIKHGGFQLLLRPQHVLGRLKKHLPQESDSSLGEMAVDLKDKAHMFFQRLCDGRYEIPSELMSYLTFPHEGTTYTEPDAPQIENPTIPAAFTFVGQFVDHDLTFNGVNLFDPQPGDDVTDFASPYIDLDSVYYRYYGPPDNTDATLKTILKHKNVFNEDGTFRLVKLGTNAYDLPRWTNPELPSRVGQAYIYDPRNDENQIILQVHILVMRAHNKLLAQIYQKNPTFTVEQAVAATQQQLIASWQSMLINDYLPRICESATLQQVLDEVKSPGYAGMHYKPAADGTLQMPHEFAIGFRFGHSMLRTAYKLNSFDPIQLFNNRDLTRKGDLRGGVPLRRDHVIDWDVFYPVNEFDASLSLKIDSKVTPVVFDLPESAIPDAIKTSGNLPYRNLVRSREIDLACGEDLAEFFGIPQHKRLTRFQVEPNDSAHYLYQSDLDTYAKPGGIGKPPANEPLKGVRDTRFKTPLWYYILREAEVLEYGERLGPLGSRLVAEVILGGIFYNQRCLLKDAAWVSPITRTSVVKLRDLINFVDENPPQLG